MWQYDWVCDWSIFNWYAVATYFIHYLLLLCYDAGHHQFIFGRWYRQKSFGNWQRLWAFKVRIEWKRVASWEIRARIGSGGASSSQIDTFQAEIGVGLPLDCARQKIHSILSVARIVHASVSSFWLLLHTWSAKDTARYGKLIKFVAWLDRLFDSIHVSKVLCPKELRLYDFIVPSDLYYGWYHGSVACTRLERCYWSAN